MFTLRSFCAFAAVMACVYWHYSVGKTLHALMWYLLAFKLLMKIPSVLHPERKKFKMVKTKSSYSNWMIAHRGGSYEAPENTL